MKVLVYTNYKVLVGITVSSVAVYFLVSNKFTFKFE